MQTRNSKLKTICLISLLFIFAFSFLLCLPGCIESSTVDSNTGQIIKTIALDPNVASAINKGAAITLLLQPVIQAASGIWPILGTIGSALAGLLTAWGLMKNKLTVATTKTEKITNATTDVIRAVNVWKELDPASWEKVKTEFAKILGPDGSAVVDGIRAAHETKAAS